MPQTKLESLMQQIQWLVLPQKCLTFALLGFGTLPIWLLQTGTPKLCVNRVNQIETDGFQLALGIFVCSKHQAVHERTVGGLWVCRLGLKLDMLYHISCQQNLHPALSLAEVFKGQALKPHFNPNLSEMPSWNYTMMSQNVTPIRDCWNLTIPSHLEISHTLYVIEHLYASLLLLRFCFQK